jgi:predicted phage terminase large subunit-like protein
MKSGNDLLNTLQAKPTATLDFVERELARRGLRHFIRRLWPVIEGGTPYKHGWHIDCIADHLQGVIDGHLTRLLINVPPRHMKSILCSVMFPAFYWLHDPTKKFLNASYAQTLSIRDCRKSRSVITHPLYTSLLNKDPAGELPWQLSSDQNVKSMYANTATGQRFATSVGGGLTGEGGDVIIVDDPHNVQDVSPTTLEDVRLWWTESMSTRLNDAETGVYIVIMQRVHEADLSGHILEADEGVGRWAHICLPARYEGRNRIVTFINDKGTATKKHPDGRPWVDERRKDETPLWPERISDDALAEQETEMSEYAKAGQLQQNPTPREGGMFNKADFVVVDGFDPALVTSSVRYWDKAGTQGGGAFTAGVLMHRMIDGSFVISHVERGQWSFAKREAKIKATTEADHELYNAPNRRAYYNVRIEQEPGSAGKESAERTIANLAGYRVQADKVTGAKEIRAEPFSVQVEKGNVKVLRQAWCKDFVDECDLFPNGKYKDQVDAAAGALVFLTVKKKNAGGW